MDHENLIKLAKIVVALKAKVRCPICLGFVENTVQLGCGHLFCNSCLQELRLQNMPLCPLCKAPIHKRTAVYKDQFADDLGKFVDRTCQLFRETYAHEVEELITINKAKLQEAIDSAPKDVCILPSSSPKLNFKDFKIPPQCAFDKLMGQPGSNINKKKLIEQIDKPKVLNFNNNDNRTRIINWLNDNQKKLDTFTQSPSFLPTSDDEGEFELPSISQVANRLKKLNKRVRSQSVTLVDNLNEPLVKRYHSLTQGLNEDDYDIEEVHSETLVKQVERKVIQDMLEDECLANMEQLAENKNKVAKKKATPKREQETVCKTKTSDIPNSGSTSGWDRIKDVKKTIKKAAKEPKKLNISLQESSNTKKPTKDGTIESPATKAAIKIKKSPKVYPGKKAVAPTKKSATVGTTVTNKENETRLIQMETTETNEEPSNIFNLSTIENYFARNMDKVKVTPDKNTSSDMEIEFIGKATKKIKDLNGQKSKSVGKENLCKETTGGKDNSDDDDIFFAPTVESLPKVPQTNKICHVAPVPIDFNDICSIAMRLSLNLRSCISSASNLPSDVSESLVDCFTNLKTYVDKMIALRSGIKEQEMQTSQIRKIVKISRAIQTEPVNSSSKSFQVKLPPVKQLSTKKIQTSQNNLRNADVQTDFTVCVDQGVQVTEHLSTRKITKEISVEKIYSLRSSLSSPQTSQDELNKSKKKLLKKTVSTTKTYTGKVPEDAEISSAMKSSEILDNPEKQILVDSSKPNKPKSRQVSEESILICSVEPTASDKSNKNIKRKLTYGEEQNRTFKRIRKPDSDSESDDDDGKPRKRRLLRDDLTIEFVDTERGSKEESQSKVAFTPESENTYDDKYLFEVMAKYGTPPPDKTSADEEQLSHKIKPNNTSADKRQNIQDKSNTETKKSQRPKKETQKDSGDHVFTGAAVFEENLEKFEKEILNYENSKAQSTEYELVENTPMLSPKAAKIPRIKVSNKTKETKKHCMNEPLQIISKRSAFSCNRKKSPDYTLSNLTQREPSTMNRNIDKVPTQTGKCTDDTAAILKDLENDDDFFKTNMDCDEHEEENVNLSKRRENVSEVLADNNGVNNLSASKEHSIDKDSLNVTQDNIDEIVESLNGFEDGDDIEAELEKISFTAEQGKLSSADKNRIRILENIKLRSQDRRKSQKGRSVVRVCSPIYTKQIIDSSDVSDEEIVETTPQKKEISSKHRSLDKLEELDNNLDFCLPPPPGFGDVETSPVPDDPKDNPVNDQDMPILGVNKSSLTPDSLTDFIVTPDTLMHKEKLTATQNEFSQQSITFKPAFATPNRLSKNMMGVLHSTPRMSQTLPSSNPLDLFSPITKTTVQFSQMKYTPLVSTSRLATKKSNLMTSTPNQKSILNYAKPIPEKPSGCHQKPKPCIMWTRILNKDMNVFTKLEVKKLLTTAASFNPRVTHLVVLVDEKGQIVSHTAKILIAIAAGIWVVRYEWAEDCLKLNRIVPEEPYEALDSSGVPGPQKSRLTRETNPLFKGFRFYCAAPILTIPKADLENILQLAGGEIARNLDDFLQSDGKVNIILTDSSASGDTEHFENLLQVYKTVTIDVEWLTQCLGQYKLVSFRAFLVSGDDSTICDLGYPPTLVESVPFTLTEGM